jgi:hypothetical protein
MATMWTLIEISFADARKADELFASPASRRDLHLGADPLAAFAVGSDTDEVRAGVRYSGEDRRHLADPQGQAPA